MSLWYDFLHITHYTIKKVLIGDIISHFVAFRGLRAAGGRYRERWKTLRLGKPSRNTKGLIKEKKTDLISLISNIISSVLLS